MEKVASKDLEQGERKFWKGHFNQALGKKNEEVLY